MDPAEEQADLIRLWADHVDQGNNPPQPRQKPLNFIEITRLPKKTDAKSLTSMILTASKIVPKKVEICYHSEDLDIIGVVEYKTAPEAFRAAEKIRNSFFGQRWIVKLTEAPRYTNPEKELVNKLSSRA